MMVCEFLQRQLLVAGKQSSQMRTSTRGIWANQNSETEKTC